MVCTPNSAAVRTKALAVADTGISARQDSRRSARSVLPRNISGGAISSKTHPTSATRTAIGTKRNIVRLTSAGAARPAISRFEPVPINVAELACVVAVGDGHQNATRGHTGLLLEFLGGRNQHGHKGSSVNERRSDTDRGDQMAQHLTRRLDAEQQQIGHRVITPV